MKQIKCRFIRWQEYDGKYYLSIGNKAPWMNYIQIRVPLFIAKLFC